MKHLMVIASVLMILSGSGFAGLPLPHSGDAFAATTFTNATIESIDSTGANLTIRALDGNAWTLPVSDAELTKGLHKGDHVSLELNVKGQVMKIVKIAS